MLKNMLSRLSTKAYKRKYHIGKKIFSGVFSDIYDAERRSDGLSVALKILTPSGAKIARMLDEDPRTRWEGEILLSLDHPNIARGYDCGTGGKYWIAMEYLDYPLNLFIARRHKEVSEPQLVEMLYGLAGAVAYLHRKGLVHRDIATDNVMLNGHTAKLIDFGMTVPTGSKVIKGRVGTPSYMAPEMIKKGEYTPGGDVYSFGMVMYEVITGTKPFSGELKEQRMTDAINMTPVAPSALGKPCSPGLERLIMSCIAKSPHMRPVDATEVVEKLAVLRMGRDKQEE